MYFDFSKLPESEYNRAVDAIKTFNNGRLYLLHDKYELSQNKLCCMGKDVSGEVRGLFEFWATQNGLI